MPLLFMRSLARPGAAFLPPTQTHIKSTMLPFFSWTDNRVSSAAVLRKPELMNYSAEK